MIEHKKGIMSLMIKITKKELMIFWQTTLIYRNILKSEQESIAVIIGVSNKTYVLEMIIPVSFLSH